jgi:hypothetical protein
MRPVDTKPTDTPRSIPSPGCEMLRAAPAGYLEKADTEGMPPCVFWPRALRFPGSRVSKWLHTSLGRKVRSLFVRRARRWAESAGGAALLNAESSGRHGHRQRRADCH